MNETPLAQALGNEKFLSFFKESLLGHELSLLVPVELKSVDLRPWCPVMESNNLFKQRKIVMSEFHSSSSLNVDSLLDKHEKYLTELNNTTAKLFHIQTYKREDEDLCIKHGFFLWDYMPEEMRIVDPQSLSQGNQQHTHPDQYQHLLSPSNYLKHPKQLLSKETPMERASIVVDIDPSSRNVHFEIFNITINITVLIIKKIINILNSKELEVEISTTTNDSIISLFKKLNSYFIQLGQLIKLIEEEEKECVRLLPSGSMQYILGSTTVCKSTTSPTILFFGQLYTLLKMLIGFNRVSQEKRPQQLVIYYSNFQYLLNLITTPTPWLRILYGQEDFDAVSYIMKNTLRSALYMVEYVLFLTLQPKVLMECYIEKKEDQNLLTVEVTLQNKYSFASFYLTKAVRTIKKNFVERKKPHTSSIMDTLFFPGFYSSSPCPPSIHHPQSLSGTWFLGLLEIESEKLKSLLSVAFMQQEYTGDPEMAPRIKNILTGNLLFINKQQL